MTKGKKGVKGRNIDKKKYTREDKKDGESNLTVKKFFSNKSVIMGNNKESGNKFNTKKNEKGEEKNFIDQEDHKN